MTAQSEGAGPERDRATPPPWGGWQHDCRSAADARNPSATTDS